MFILLTDNGLNADTCQEEIKSKKVLCVFCVCVCSTLCCSSVYSLKAIHPYCALVQSEVQYSQSKHNNLFIIQNQPHFSANIWPSSG